MSILRRIFFFCVLFGICPVMISISGAAKLKSYCVMDENSSEATGLNTDLKMPIASVSKLFTSLFAVTQNPINRKIYTQFFYTPAGQNSYDVHIKGSHDPYFGRPALQWMIAKLNEQGVVKIRNLTFDENFKYYHETDKKNLVGRRLLNPVSGKDDIDAPSADEIKTQLLQKAEISKNYAKTYKEALTNSVQLPKDLKFNPVKIEFLSSEKFVTKPETKKGFIASPELLHMLKLMNWNSNNHAANQLFQFSGGVSQFNDFFYTKMGFTEQDLKFVNGSGQNAMVDGNGRLYNEATCKTVVRAVKGLKKALEIQNAKLEDAVAVVGGDIGSTVSGKSYNNPMTKLSVVAKTGTVGTNITLAGTMSTQTGIRFFFFSVEVNAAPARVKNKNAWVNQEANRARSIISAQLNQIIKKNGGPKPIQYKTQFFDLDNFEEAEASAQPDLE